MFSRSLTRESLGLHRKQRGLTARPANAYQRGSSDRESCFHTKPFNLHFRQQVKWR